jgi:hypothetical protein
MKNLLIFVNIIGLIFLLFSNSNCHKQETSPVLSEAEIKAKKMYERTFVGRGYSTNSSRFVDSFPDTLVISKFSFRSLQTNKDSGWGQPVYGDSLANSVSDTLYYSYHPNNGSFFMKIMPKQKLIESHFWVSSIGGYRGYSVYYKME